MCRLRICLVVATIGFVVLHASGFQAAASETPTVARLERLKPSDLLLKRPRGLPSGFTVARTAPDVDFAVFPGQFSGARLWSSWGDVLAGSDGPLKLGTECSSFRGMWTGRWTRSASECTIQIHKACWTKTAHCEGGDYP